MLLIGSSSLFYLILHVANWILIICTASHFLIMAAGLCLPQSSMTLTTVCLPLPWSFMAFPPCGGISQTISLFKLDIHNIITVTDEHCDTPNTAILLVFQSCTILFIVLFFDLFLVLF